LINPLGPTKIKNPPTSGFLIFGGVGLGETGGSGSTKCDYESILVARAQRRRPEGVRTREASALETIRLVLPKFENFICGNFRDTFGVLVRPSGML
jgi:hypothetical protein